MGVLQQIFTGNRSNDVVCASGYNKMVPYELWAKQQNAYNVEKSGPVTTIAVSKDEIDQVLSKLGVVQRGGNSTRVDHSLPVSDIREIPIMDKKDLQEKSQIGLQPKDLTVDDIQECMDGDIKYQEIMEMYGFTSERYFKETIRKLGYRLLRGELWVVKDKLWQLTLQKRIEN